MINLAEVPQHRTILTDLRERTRKLHEETETAVDLFHCLRSEESYGDLLSRFYGLYAPIEHRLAKITGWESIGVTLSERAKANLIPDDLHALGWSDSRIDQIPTCPTLPRINTMGEALGSMYVLEGSTLGAQQICATVGRRLGLTADRGCSFFNGYGSDRTTAMWRSFGASVIAYQVAQPATANEIVSAACDTFVRVKEWIACREI